MTMFLILAAAAIALALGFVLIPLLSKGAKHPPAALVLSVIFLIPATTLALYHLVGTPDGIRENDTGMQSLNQAIAQLARRLEREPDDAAGWLLLGLTYKQLQQYPSAEQALRRAVVLDENNAQAKVELAETILFAHNRPNMPDESRLLLEQAVGIDPRQQKALWLLGIADFQTANYAGALDWWERLDAELEDGSVRESVREQLARARAQLGSNDQPDAPGANIIVTVTLDETLAQVLQGDETVFVYARATDGPPMPLAIQSLRADDLPAVVQLSDRDAMTPELRLSQFDEVIVTARVSQTGEAVPQPGDLQGESETLSTGHGRRVSVVINQRLD